VKNRTHGGFAAARINRWPLQPGPWRRPADPGVAHSPGPTSRCPPARNPLSAV